MKSKKIEETWDENWKNRLETDYNHWSIKPTNQIQLAFYNHWSVINEKIKSIPNKKVVEFGAGRGSISSFFADSGYSCTLLDSSEAIITKSQKIFKKNNHKGNFIIGDAKKTDLKSGEYGVCISIGLLEHFDDFEKILDEKIRVLAKEGICINYVVPDNDHNIQSKFSWVNSILRFFANIFLLDKNKDIKDKQIVYRTKFSSIKYIEYLKKHNQVKEIESFGVYPLPMVSYSVEFPFTLLPSFLEKSITSLFKAILKARKILFNKNPWICKEKNGQAFMIIFRKK